MKDYEYKEEKVKLEDAQFLLINAIDNLTKELSMGRRK